MSTYNNGRGNPFSKRPSQQRMDKALAILTEKLTLNERRAILGLFTLPLREAAVLINWLGTNPKPNLTPAVMLADCVALSREVGGVGSDLQNILLTEDEQDAIENESYFQAEAAEAEAAEAEAAEAARNDDDRGYSDRYYR
jgi:hypothetical protein